MFVANIFAVSTASEALVFAVSTATCAEALPLLHHLFANSLATSIPSLAESIFLSLHQKPLLQPLLRYHGFGILFHYSIY